MPSPYDQNDLILTQRNSSDTHFNEVRVADVPNTVLSFDGSSTIRTLAYSQNDDSGSLIQRDSSGDAAIGSRLYFTDASANNGTTALIGLNASTARDFAIYDYAMVIYNWIRSLPIYHQTLLVLSFMLVEAPTTCILLRTVVVMQILLVFVG